MNSNVRREVGANNELFVWIYPESSADPMQCGALELVGGRLCRFEYAPSWLARADAFELSPDLPLRPGKFEPPAGLHIHPIFADAGPDRWGRQIIDRVFRLRRSSEIDYLAVAGEDRIGALGFSLHADRYDVVAEQALHTADLGALLSAAQAIERRMPIDEDMRRLLRPGASAGGARPKAIIQADGRRWLAKFPAEGDSVDVCAIEHASLRLAAACGIVVPDSRLTDVGGRNVLLVERFDRDEAGGRIHFASARTLLIAQGVDIGAAAYSDIADTARRFSRAPKADVQEVFRRMVFNVAMENTDDHEKNHAFLWQDGHWALAPAYDVQPQLQGIHYQQLKVGRLDYEPTIRNALSDCGRFMLTEPEARREVGKMMGVLAKWPEQFAAAGVRDDDIEACARYVRVDEMAKELATLGEKPVRASRRSASPSPGA
ncbi:type II toxin-antitoxin system HipA family toxin [Burkholderia pseudomallei]|uniref:type II toxin-antitoxin system HipA family toxin n=1 Tax=Burkholderia pseudomallei TaxID=28450 RepID=UPI000A1A0C72|nr:type II toxin-antitoxin system HipA family toxin [Burkholderia pseudomallei]ARL04280.1 HipA protein [Burkholderia pseudomallei]